jgi:hypothetical protein
MKYLSLASVVALASSSDHEGHDHSALKPHGAYYGILTKMNQKGDKNWNNMEVQFTFGSSTFDMGWWFGIQNSLVEVEKQVFKCTSIPFTFDESNLAVIVHPESNDCLKAVNANFPPSMGLDDPYHLPVDHETGDIEFKLAAGLVKVDMYPIDVPLAEIPSGQNGLAPNSIPARRGTQETTYEVKPCCRQDNNKTEISVLETKSANVTGLAESPGNGAGFAGLTSFAAAAVAMLLL